MTQITIVMPIYNNENDLNGCLASIFNQTFKDFRLICINDGSTDGSLNILNGFKTNHKDRLEILTQPNQGAGAARNNGLEHVNSECVVFLDADDTFAPDFLEKLHLQYTKTSADIVICEYNTLLPNGKLFSKNHGLAHNLLPQKEIFNKSDIPELIFNFTNMAAWNKLYKTDFLKKHNLKFQTTSDSNDVFFTLSSLYHAEKITVVKEILISYNFLNPSATTTNRNKKPNFHIFDEFKELKEQLKTDSKARQLEKSLYNALLSSVFYSLNFLRGDNQKDFIKKIKQEIPLRAPTYAHKRYQYNRLFLIKILPISLFIMLFECKRAIKSLLIK